MLRAVTSELLLAVVAKEELIRRECRLLYCPSIKRVDERKYPRSYHNIFFSSIGGFPTHITTLLPHRNVLASDHYHGTVGENSEAPLGIDGGGGTNSPGSLAGSLESLKDRGSQFGIYSFPICFPLLPCLICPVHPALIAYLSSSLYYTQCIWTSFLHLTFVKVFA